MPLNDKQILITGATNGIGLAAAEALAAFGCGGGLAAYSTAIPANGGVPNTSLISER